MLRVIKHLKERSPLSIKASFLGAHTYPPAYREDHAGYIDLIIDHMLPVIARGRALAELYRRFLRVGFFSPEETETICRAGMSHGLQPKIHANQLSLSGRRTGGRQTGRNFRRSPGDHGSGRHNDSLKAIRIRSQDLVAYGRFFPAHALPTGKGPLIDAGCAVALASGFQPRLFLPLGNMNLVVSLSCIQMRMLPEEAINAATLNGAYAMGTKR